MKDYFVHESAIIDEGVVIGTDTFIWHFSHLQTGAIVGKNCRIGQNVYIGSNAVVGDYVKIQNNVSVYEGVELEDYVFCGPSCVFTNDLTPRSKYPKESQHFKKTIVHVGATIGANATIVCGVDIGAWAFIGAGAVIVKNVPAYALMIGVPAKRYGWICECGETLPDSLRCNTCKRAYKETEKGLVQF